MKNKNLIKLLVFFVCLFFQQASMAQANNLQLNEQEKQFLLHKKHLTMCVAPNFMPYEKIADGQYIGLIAEYMKKYSDSLGIPFKLVLTKDWSETVEFAKKKKCDLVPFMIPTENRRKYLNFTKPYFGEPLVIATLEDKPFVVDIEDVVKQRLGIVKGYAYVEIYRRKYPQIDIVEVKDTLDGLQRLENGELYGFIDGLNVIGYTLQKNAMQGIKINGTIGNENDGSIGSRKDTPMITQILNKAIDSLSDNEKQRIKNSWVTIQYQHSVDYSKLIEISIGLLFVFAFMIYHQIILRRHNRELEALSETDKLTKINNRLKLDKFLQYHLDLFQRYHDVFSIILIDIDHFKQFNDKFGHLIGDKVLTHVAGLLKENCRNSDMVGRWGGEEFLMICPKTNSQEVKVLAETLRQNVAKNHLDNVEGVTVSLGVAEITVSDNFNTIINRADKALYLAKENGRNRCEG